MSSALHATGESSWPESKAVANKSNRIWVLTERYFPEETSTGYLLTQLAEGLAEIFEVGVITGPPSVHAVPVSAPRREVRNGVRIFRCRGTSFDKNGIVARFVNWATRIPPMIGMALRHCGRGDSLLVVTNPPLLPFFALLVKWLRGCRLVLLVHDVYPEVLTATGWIRAGSRMDRLGFLANSLLYRQADRIVTIGRDMTRLTERKVPDRTDRIVCIPNWAENTLVRPTERPDNPLLAQLGLVEKVVVLYAGNLGRAQGIEELAEAASRLDRSDPDIHFLIIGFGARKRWLEEYVTSRGLRNVTILDRLPRSEQIVFLNACDIALVSLVRGMAGVGVPSRMYNQLAAGKPQVVIADDWSEHALLVREEEIGWVVEPGDGVGLVETLRAAARDPERRREMGARAARVAQTRFSFEQIVGAYARLFYELGHQAGPVVAGRSDPVGNAARNGTVQ